MQVRLTKLEIRFQGFEAQLFNPQRPTVGSPSTPTSDRGCRLPDFHHGAGHKMLQYWPRLRVKLTLPTVDILSFVKDAERDDSVAIACQNWTSFDDRTAFGLALTRAHENLQSSLTHMPLSVFTLLTYSDVFTSAAAVTHLSQYLESYQQTPVAEFCNQIPLASLLLSGIALWYSGANDVATEEQDRHAAQVCLRAGLSRLWQIYAEPEEVMLPLSICYSQILLYMHAQPYAALGLLKATDTTLDRLQRRSFK